MYASFLGALVLLGVTGFAVVVSCMGGRAGVIPGTVEEATVVTQIDTFVHDKVRTDGGS
jgi:hypothetical protein